MDISDEMEKLYIHLKEASLSPIGDRKPSTKREFRASFIKRCKNHVVNDRLHRIRTLNSTLKVAELPSSGQFFYSAFLRFFFFLPRQYFQEVLCFCLFQSKEADLQVIEQILTDQALTADKFRGWKVANVALVQDICARQGQQVAAEAGEAAAALGEAAAALGGAAPVVETSL